MTTIKIIYIQPLRSGRFVSTEERYFSNIDDAIRIFKLLSKVPRASVSLFNDNRLAMQFVNVKC